MAKLIYAAIASLDGYVEDEEGRFDWAAPDDEVHAFVNDLERPIGTHLYGRRMYETMVFWETVSTEADQPAVIRDFAGIWRAAEKIVYSRALQTVSSARTRIEREFDRDAVRRLKQSSGADITVGGAELAGHAIGAGLVDECHLFLCPIVVGGGKRALPDNVRAQLELLDERRFRNGGVPGKTEVHHRRTVGRRGLASLRRSQPSWTRGSGRRSGRGEIGPRPIANGWARPGGTAGGLGGGAPAAGAGPGQPRGRLGARAPGGRRGRHTSQRSPQTPQPGGTLALPAWPNRVPTGLPNPARRGLAWPPSEFKMPPRAPPYHPLRRPGNAVYGVNSYRGFDSLSLRQCRVSGHPDTCLRTSWTLGWPRGTPRGCWCRWSRKVHRDGHE